MRGVRRAAFAAALAFGPAGSAVADDLAVAYLAENCLACHGAGAGDGIPKIAGRPAAELAGLLAAFRDGTRKSAIMNVAAAGLDPVTVEALAAYLAAAR